MLQNVNIKKLSLFFNMIQFSSEFINYVKCPTPLLNIIQFNLFTHQEPSRKNKNIVHVHWIKKKKKKICLHIHVSTYNMKIEYSLGCPISLTWGSAAWHLTSATVLLWPTSVCTQALVLMSQTRADPSLPQVSSTSIVGCRSMEYTALRCPW